MARGGSPPARARLSTCLSLSLRGIIRISIHFRLLVGRIKGRKEGGKDGRRAEGIRVPSPCSVLFIHREIGALTRQNPSFICGKWYIMHIGRSVCRWLVVGFLVQMSRGPEGPEDPAQSRNFAKCRISYLTPVRRTGARAVGQRPLGERGCFAASPSPRG